MALSPYRNLQSPLDVARSLAAAGQFRKARAAYRKALKLAPDRAEILSELGSAEAQCGNLAAARQLMEKAVRLSPSKAAFHFNLGEVERTAERYPEAERCFRKVLAIEPRDADALFGLGTALLLQQKPEEAIEPLTAAHRLQPRDPEILNELGNALAALKRYSEAVATYLRALDRRQDYADCWLNLALCFYDAERHPEANRAFDRAAALQPIPVQFLWKRALAQAQCSLYDEASANIEAYIAADPDSRYGYYARGMIAQYRGRFDDSETAFRRAIGLAPRFAEAYEQLAVMKRASIEDAPALEALLAEGSDVSDTSRVAAGFALYRIYDRAGETDRAFPALAAANALVHRLDPFDAEAHVAKVRANADVFTAEFLREHEGQGISSDAPIFILGMPRSGTTLTEQILAASPSVFAGGEQIALHNFTSAIPDYPGCLRDVPPDWAAAQATRLLAELTSRSVGGERFVTDKTPANYRNVGLISWLFPNARIIYCLRDPMDVGFSCYEQHFHNALNYAYDFNAFARAWRAHEEIMAHWHTVLPGRIHTVHYEKLIADPAVEAKKLVEFCNMEWDDAFLETTRVERPIQTASLWQARQPINASSIGKWRRYEGYLSPLKTALGLP